MSYGLKYMQYVGKGDARVLIRVYVKGWAGRSYGMAHITAASLQVIGGREDILSPVIKTLFSFSLVDAWDEGTTQDDGTECVNQMYEKCGRWEEFFTPDATKFKVEAAAAAPGEMPKVIWTGYVTPDSWSENLVYHGSVTITARDMLGALDNLEFDLAGRVSVIDVVSGALGACSCPMALTYNRNHFLYNENGLPIYKHNFSSLVFAGDDWWQALTETLESLGLALRWNGRNGMVLTSYRYLKADTQPDCHEMDFVNRSGLRELSPALKYVTETFDIKIEDIQALDPNQSRFSPTGQAMTQKQEWPSGGHAPEQVSVPMYSLSAPLSGGWTGYLGVPRPDNLLGNVPDRGIYFVTDVTTDGVMASYYDDGIVGPFKVKISLDGGVLVYTADSVTSYLTAEASFNNHQVTEMEVQVRCIVNNQTKYLSGGGWVSEVTSRTIQPGTEIEVPACEGGSQFAVSITHITTTSEGVPSVSGFYCVALNVEFTAPTSSTFPTEIKTTTNYDEQNNVTITRDPVVASAAAPMSADFCINLLGYGNSLVGDSWNWPGEEDFYPIAVMIQAQIVCFHSAPASVFTGTAYDGKIALPGYGLEYYGRECVIVSATYDFCSGLIQQLNAREVYDWADVWGTFSPEYTIKTGAGQGSTSDTGDWGGGSTDTPKGAFNNDYSDDFNK